MEIKKGMQDLVEVGEIEFGRLYCNQKKRINLNQDQM